MNDDHSSSLSPSVTSSSSSTSSSNTSVLYTIPHHHDSPPESNNHPTTQLTYQIRSMSEMTNQFPELAAIAQGRSSCAISEVKRRPRKAKDPLVEQSQSLKEDSSEKHERNANDDKWKHPLLKEVYSMLPDYKYVEMSRAIVCSEKEKVERMLQLGQMTLILSKSHHESRLLGQSGSFMHEGRFIHYPACQYGKHCKGMNKHYWYRNQQTGVIWMSYLYTHELNQLEINGIYNGSSRPCVLCLRDMALKTEITNRLLDKKSQISGEVVTSSSSSSSSQSSTDNENKTDEESNIFNYLHPTCQMYFNLVDQPNGYHHDFVITSEPGRPLIAPIARPNLSLLTTYNLPSGRLFVNQEAILWRSPILSSPQPGDNIQGF